MATGSAGTPTARVNPVIQAAVRAAAPAEMLDRAAKAAADALLEAWPDDEPGAWSAEAFRSCAASLQRVAGDLLWAGGCHPLLLRAGESLDRAHLAGPAVAYWRQLATLTDQVLGPDHADTLAAGHRLAHAYLAAGRATEAVSWFQWALADRARTLGANHPGTITARLNLGRALVAADQIGDAITVLSAAVSDYERVRGKDHPDTLSARDELAAAHQAGRPVRGCDPAVPPHAVRPRACPGRPESGYHRHPAEAGRHLPGRWPGQERHFPVQAGPRRPGTRPRAGPSRHDRGPRQPRRRLPFGRAHGLGDAVQRAGQRGLREGPGRGSSRTPWPAA